MTTSSMTLDVRIVRAGLAALALAVLAACGGTQSPPPPPPVIYASGLDYADPVSTGWRLVRDPASTPTVLVLDLVGPTGLKTRGVGLNVQAPAEVTFTASASGMLVESTGVYALDRAGNDEPQPRAIAGGIKAGNVLTVGVFQKDRNQDAKDSGAPLLRVRLALTPAASLVAGTTLPLTVLKARAIPEDIGLQSDDPSTLYRKMRMADLSVALGVLTAR